MKPTDILARRREIEQVVRVNYPYLVPEFAHMPTVAVSRDFAHYVAAMTDAWPEVEAIDWPAMDEARWPFPKTSAMFVFEEPIRIEFLLIAETEIGTGRGRMPLDHARPDEQEVIGLVVLSPRLTAKSIILDVDGRRVGLMGELPDPLQPQHSLFVHPIGAELSGTAGPWGFVSVTDGKFAWGLHLTKNPDEPHVGQCARWERSFAEALGHRLSALDTPDLSVLPRPERRAVARHPADYRILHLRTPERARARGDESHPVAWSKRWWTRGHWRRQPYGPRDTPSYRTIWIDPFLKGPDELPIEDRPDLFRAD